MFQLRGANADGQSGFLHTFSICHCDAIYYLVRWLFSFACRLARPNEVIRCKIHCQRNVSVFPDMGNKMKWNARDGRDGAAGHMIETR